MDKKQYKGQKTHRKLMVRPMADDKDYRQRLLFKALKPDQPFKEIYTLSVYNDYNRKTIVVTFSDGKEIVKRELKIRKIDSRKQIYITYNDYRYLLKSNLINVKNYESKHLTNN